MNLPQEGRKGKRREEHCEPLSKGPGYGTANLGLNLYLFYGKKGCAKADQENLALINAK